MRMVRVLCLNYCIPSLHHQHSVLLLKREVMFLVSCTRRPLPGGAAHFLCSMHSRFRADNKRRMDFVYKSSDFLKGRQTFHVMFGVSGLALS